VPDPTVAIAILLLLQVPPVVPSLNVVVKPTQTDAIPVIAAGTGFTVTTAVCLQPVDNVQVIVDVPELTPLTTPDEEPTVATDVVLLLHVAPEPPLSVVVLPAHTVNVPVITGTGLTVTTAVAVTVPQLKVAV
jgi:hypothetical protein